VVDHGNVLERVPGASLITLPGEPNGGPASDGGAHRG
jgi:hypothetical protein